MQLSMWSAVLCMLLVWGVCGDLYLQNPRGNNDRLNENNDNNPNRQNANRLFDSQNNAKGGYCKNADANGNNPSAAPLSFVTGSILPIEWTAQHGCGGEHVTCTEIIQYMCTDTNSADDQVRDGTTTTTIPTNANQYNQKNAGNGEYVYGLNEPLQNYKDCAARLRNLGLFTADQIITLNRSTNTRQNPQGNNNQHGFECAEERDYYPYWHPSPWKDIAVLTDTMEHCAFYQQESQNVKAKNYCQYTPTNNQAVPNNAAGCAAVGGQWTSKAAWGLPAPNCSLAIYSRDNHLGNTGNATQTSNYTWILPTPAVEPCITTGTCACVLRVRYNITTNESSGLTGEFLDVRNNSAIKQNPQVTVEGVEVTLALNTAQYGRTFQDRSYMFKIAPRPAGVADDAKIYNLNVRGKRGNIVETFPATEYDYIPNSLTVEQGDYVHFQWTGCDLNPNGNEGQGIVRTDRSNIMQIENLDSNIPISPTAAGITPLFDSPELRYRMAKIDQTNCLPYSQLNPNTAEQDPRNCGKLNAALSPTFDGGVIRMNQTGTYYYTNSRNNNFSNRTQKGKLVVNGKEEESSTSKVGVAVGVTLAVVAVAAGCIGGAIFYGKRNPHSSIGRMVERIPTPSFGSDSPAPTMAARREPLLHTQ